jgi:hypothetical protein
MLRRQAAILFIVAKERLSSLRCHPANLLVQYGVLNLAQPLNCFNAFPKLLGAAESGRTLASCGRSWASSANRKSFTATPI